jgi:hypothetical protein
MQEPVSEDVARGRWLAINAVRLGGVVMVIVGLLGLRGYFEYPVVMVIVGILGLRGVFDYPALAGYVLIGVGLLDVFLVPLLLARKWRSPLE